jgi:hypothetical protein
MNPGVREKKVVAERHSIGRTSQLSQEIHGLLMGCGDGRGMTRAGENIFISPRKRGLKQS